MMAEFDSFAHRFQEAFHSAHSSYTLKATAEPTCAAPYDSLPPTIPHNQRQFLRLRRRMGRRATFKVALDRLERRLLRSKELLATTPDSQETTYVKWTFSRRNLTPPLFLFPQLLQIALPKFPCQPIHLKPSKLNLRVKRKEILLVSVGHMSIAYLLGKGSGKALQVNPNVPLLMVLSILPDIDIIYDLLFNTEIHRGPTIRFVRGFIVRANLS